MLVSLTFQAAVEPKDTAFKREFLHFSGDEKLLTPEYYETGILVHDPVNILQDLLEDFSAKTNNKEQ
jgi:hypothetical protein